MFAIGAGAAVPGLPADTSGLPIEGRALDVAFVADDVVAVLLEDGVALYRRRGTELRPIDRRPLEAPLVARAPAGIIVAEAGAFWVSTNRAPGAILFTTDGGRLQETQRADALPFPGSAQGARFDEGTNLVAVDVPGLGGGPHLRVGGGPVPWAIAPDGRLGDALSGWTDTRVGSAAALLWPRTWIASSRKPPGHGDALSVIRRGIASQTVASFPPPTSVTAVSARASGDGAIVVAAIADGTDHRLLFVEVTRERP